MGKTIYPDYIRDRIIERLMSGEGLNTICMAEGMPAESTVREWVVDDVDGFAAKYARARDIGMDALADRMRETARLAMGLPPEGVSAAKLAIDTDKWYLSKIAPKKFGEKLDLTSKGEQIATTIVGLQITPRKPDE